MMDDQRNRPTAVGSTRAMLKAAYAEERLSPAAAARLTERVAASASGRQSVSRRRSRYLRVALAAGLAAVVLVSAVVAGLPWLTAGWSQGPGDEPGTEAVPGLASGSTADGEAAVGYRAGVPGYLPPDAVWEITVWSTGAGEGEATAIPFLSLTYQVAGRSLSVTTRPARGEWSMIAEDHASGDVSIHGLATEVRVTSPEPGDAVSTGWTTIRWVDGDWHYEVSGDLELGTLVAVAESVGR